MSSPALVSLTSRALAHEQSFHKGTLAARAPGIGVLECDSLVVWAGGLWGVVNTGLVTGTEVFSQLTGIGCVGTRSGCVWSYTVHSFLPTQYVRSGPFILRAVDLCLNCLDYLFTHLPSL